MGSALVAAGSFSPLDEELELLPGSLTPGLEEVLVRLGSWMPFAQAQQLLLDWMKLDSLSEATVRRHTEGAGAAYVAIQEEEARMLEQGGGTAPGFARFGLSPAGGGGGRGDGAAGRRRMGRGKDGGDRGIG